KRSNQLSFAPEKNNEHAARGDNPFSFLDKTSKRQPNTNNSPRCQGQIVCPACPRQRKKAAENPRR
ncbi:MAG: hypothetical protein ACYC2W_12705, partial [Desulfurivibrionaceae bacterium]